MPRLRRAVPAAGPCKHTWLETKWLRNCIRQNAHNHYARMEHTHTCELFRIYLEGLNLLGVSGILHGVSGVLPKPKPYLRTSIQRCTHPACRGVTLQRTYGQSTALIVQARDFATVTWIYVNTPYCEAESKSAQRWLALSRICLSKLPAA